MYIVIEKTGEVTQTENFYHIMEDEYESGIIDIICVDNEGIKIYNGAGKWSEIIKREVY